MSNNTALPAGQQLHTGVFLHGEQHDDYSTGNSSSSQETSGPPPSYTVTDTFSHFNSDVKPRLTEIQGDTSLADSPTQLPFDDLIGSSLTRRILPVPPRQQHDSLESPVTHVRPEPQSTSTYEAESPRSLQTPPQKSVDVPRPRQRPELPHTPMSTPDTRNTLGQISELKEVDLYGSKSQGEGPFEAGRRAQRTGDRAATKSSSSSGPAYVKGRFPSIKPGEIMPINTMRPTQTPPSFFPPLEAPPFPPTMHNPIRPAHFPANLHPPPPTAEPTRASSHQQPPLTQAPLLPRSHSHHTSPPPSQPVAPAPANSAAIHSHRQPPQELLRSHSQSIPHPYPPQPTRSHSHQNALPSRASQYQEYPSAPHPSRRHTYDARNGVPPGLAPTGRYPVSQPPPPMPHGQPPPPIPYGQPPPHHDPPAPPSRSQSQDQQHHATVPRSALRDPHRHSIAAPAPSHVQFTPPVPSPVRLPSQNIPTPQALGIVHSPPTPSASPHPDNSRPPRATPKPVMPSPLAPLAAQERNLDRGGAGQLQRSASSAVFGGEKGGFLSKTRSILRKRSSTTGIKTHVDGAISFAPTMPNLMEENSVEGRKIGKRLSRKK